MAHIEFIEGIIEEVLPIVNLTQTKDKKHSTVYLTFKHPSILRMWEKYEGEIKSLRLFSDGCLFKEIKAVNVIFLNGIPDSIEATYTMNSDNEVFEFYNFMEKFMALDNEILQAREKIKLKDDEVNVPILLDKELDD